MQSPGLLGSVRAARVFRESCHVDHLVGDIPASPRGYEHTKLKHAKEQAAMKKYEIKTMIAKDDLPMRLV